ncbi:DNA polymerase [Aeromonas hydrophila]|uniref:DNA polymerase n=1 Tax=Aeromonas hydrophila TaxID=644 RepID=UPI001CF0BBFD|nr:DNA polymerase [Aeromonas hydrophila]UCM61218.1 DNA polymerase [Aeromonas hydrophila]
MFEFKRAEIGVIEEDQPEHLHLPFEIRKVRFDEKTAKQDIQLADGEDLWIGIDAEWVTRDGQNTVLSYQSYCINSRGEEHGMIHYPESGKRFSFEKFISRVVEDCRAAGLVKKWPRKLVVVAHFLRADLTTFSNFWGLKTQVKAQGGSVGGRILTGSGYGVDETVERARKAKPAPIVFRDRNHRKQQSIIEFVDTLFLAPNKSPLSALGAMLGLPKLEIPDGYSIERMDELLAGNKEAFEQYALRDAQIAVKYALKVRDFLGGQFGLQKLPRSLGAVGVAVFRQLLKAADVDYMAAFGLVIKKEERWNSGKGKVATKAVKRPSPDRWRCEALAICCYHGGRNESFMIGPTPIGDWYDWDLKGAYTTGLCDLLEPDYANMYTSSDPQDFIGHVMGFAYVEFAFPAGTRFPCLPVRSEQYGLRFPLSGLAYVTAPEIELALSMGATIAIKHGVIVPWVAGSQPLFEDFTRMIQRLRREYPKKSLEEVMVKEIGNSLYGKLAQGLSDKTAFDTATGLSKKIGPSAVTNPYMAAHTTGLIRAVCGELLHRIPAHRTVVSVTTDGFLTDAPLEELDQTGPLCRRYQALCQRLHGDEEVGQ